LGAITINPGTPVSVLANFPTQTSLVANKVEFSNLWAPGGGVAYIGYSGMNTATFAGVLKVLQPGESWSLTHNVGLNVIPVKDLVVDGAVGGDLVLVSCHVA
jgi:hypothetical protein